MEKTLFDSDVYDSDKRKLGFLAGVLPSLVLYSKFIKIVVKASHQAKQEAYDYDEWAKSSWDVLRALESIGTQFHVSGIDYLRAEPERPCVIVANHMSILETLILPGIVQPNRNVTFVVKQSLLDYPVFKHVMRSRNPIAVTRTNPRQDLKAVLEGGKERLDNGISVIVFPQTTRTHEFDPAQFNTIGVKLAQRANVPVIPCALKSDAWQNGAILKDFGRIDTEKTVYFEFGPPMEIARKGAEEHEAIMQFISGRIERWKSHGNG